MLHLHHAFPGGPEQLLSVGVNRDAKDRQLLPLMLKVLKVGAVLAKLMGVAGFIQGRSVLLST